MHPSFSAPRVLRAKVEVDDTTPPRTYYHLSVVGQQQPAVLLTDYDFSTFPTLPRYSALFDKRVFSELGYD